jgi:hypothetical protein
MHRGPHAASPLQLPGFETWSEQQVPMLSGLDKRSGCFTPSTLVLKTGPGDTT